MNSWGEMAASAAWLSRLEPVSSITIDDLCKAEGVDEKRLVIKLDVEGLEIESLEGGRSALANDFLLIYEDHGKDFDCEVTQYVLDQGFEVFSHANERFKQVTAIKDAQAIKTLKTTGYNFFAFRRKSAFSAAFQKPG